MSKIKTHVKKGDKVEVISGYHKGKQGDILTINATKGQVLVQGVRMIKKELSHQNKIQKEVFWKSKDLSISLMLRRSKLLLKTTLGVCA